MGAKQTKIDDGFLSGPAAQSQPSKWVNNVDARDDALDPRSPTGSRTPICLQNNRINTTVQLAHIEIPAHEHSADHPLDILRKRFFKGFTYNLNDPRSPSLHLNRTPLVFEDTLEQSLTLDDTFADLFVESHLPVSVNDLEVKSENKSEEDGDVEMVEEHTKAIMITEVDSTPRTPRCVQQDFDPRSASIGVERTPIIFTDDEVGDANEDVMLENILTTLSLNLNTSANNSMVSMASDNVKADFDETYDVKIVSKPKNKHLDRVRVGKKTSTKVMHRKSKRRLSRQQIYEDQENQMPTTPKLKASENDKNDIPKEKRTPLSCVRNRNATHTRSRSVESSAKIIKRRLALTSYDDTLNPTDNYNVAVLHIPQQDSSDSLQF